MPMTKERAERTRTKMRKRRSRRRALLPRASARQVPPGHFRGAPDTRVAVHWCLTACKWRLAQQPAAHPPPQAEGALALQHKLAPGEPDFIVKWCACWPTRRGAPVQAEGAPSTSKPKKEPAKKKSRGGDDDDEDVSHRSAACCLLWVACRVVLGCACAVPLQTCCKWLPRVRQYATSRSGPERACLQALTGSSHAVCAHAKPCAAHCGRWPSNM